VLMEDESSTMKIDGIEINNYFGGDLDVYAPITSVMVILIISAYMFRKMILPWEPITPIVGGGI